MKKAFALSLALLVALAALLAACSKENAPPAEESAQTDESNLTPPGTYPIVKKPITLKVLIVGSDTVEDYNTNTFTKWYEEKTGINLQFDVLPPGMEANDKLNLVMASGDLPDVILHFGVSPAQQMLYGQQGLFVPLNDLIEKYGDNTKLMFDQFPAVKDAITAPNGQIYALPQISECYQCSLFQKAWIYKPWLDKLGLKVPETTDEFYNVLKAFKTQDPNGNGKADETPLASVSPGNGWGAGIDRFLMDAFVNNNQYNGNTRLSLNGGKIEADFATPQWKEGLAWIHKLYAEGLIAPESFTVDTPGIKQLAYSDDQVKVGVLRAPGPSSAFLLFDPATKNTGWDYVAVPPLQGPDGFRSTPWNPYPFVVPQGTFLITSANKYPVETMRWADGFYSQEVTLKWAGIPSASYKLLDRKDASKLGMDGKPALYEALETHNTVQNEHWSQIGISLRDKDFWNGLLVTDKTKDQQVLYEETVNKYEPYKQKLDTIVPPLFFTEEQSSELADLSTSINTYVDEMFARFVTGDENIDSGWQNYLDTLTKMNVNRYLEIYQAAYDAKKK